MSTAIQAAQDTYWSAPSSEKAWPGIFTVVSQALCHQSRISGRASSPTVSGTEIGEKTYQRLLDIWNSVRQSTASLPSMPLDISDTPTLPFAVSLRHVMPSFVSRILSAIDQEPVEDGFEHPAEEIIGWALSQQPQDVILWLQSLVSEEKDSCIVASVIACVARLNEHECLDWGYRLVAQALQRQDIEVRDSAAQALELWGTPAAVNLLKKHTESVPWLRDYIERVIQQLERR